MIIEMNIHATDAVVTVPKGKFLDWIAEGDAAGDPPTGIEWGFYISGMWNLPLGIHPGSRLYVVAWGRLRGYAPITRVVPTSGGFAFCRESGAVAVTIPEQIPGFRGWRKRWWDRAIEVPFSEWRTP